MSARRFLKLAAICCMAAGVAGAALASPPPGGHEQMLRQLIHDAAQGQLHYETLDPGLAAAVRPMADTARSELTALGGLTSVTLVRTDKDGFEFYRTQFEKGALDWAFRVNAAGLIDNAAYRPAKE